jgi:acyl homoserine lactone synthase
MLQLIAPEHRQEFAEAFAEMHRLRYRVFKERLDWDVHVENGLEIDSYDALDAVYLLQWAPDGKLQGCVRLLPTTGPNMLREVFSELLGGAPPPSDPRIWESSRFAIDLLASGTRSEGGLASATYELFAGMIEFGLSRNLAEIVTVTDVRMERILRRAGWPLRRIGVTKIIGSTTAVSGMLEVSSEALDRIKAASGIRARVLWVPVPIAGP